MMYLIYCGSDAHGGGDVSFTMKLPHLRSSCDTKRGHPDAMFMLFLGFPNDMLMGSVLTTCISAIPLVQELEGDFVCEGPWPGKMLCKWGRRLEVYLPLLHVSMYCGKIETMHQQSTATQNNLYTHTWKPWLMSNLCE